MEGCPKPVMISFDTKETSPSDFDAIKTYIRDYYQEPGDGYKEEVQQLNKLRKGIGAVTRDNQGCIALRRYYAQLQFLQSRFPMGEGGAAAIAFTWYDVYNGDPVTQKDIRFEQACVLFNLGGLYSQLGASENRSSEEAMKTACTYFQCAAGIFQFLLDNFSLDSFCDMAREILQLKLTIMLGQAQECLLEKSIRDNRKDVLIARICAQVETYYDDALKLLDSSSTADMGSTLRKSWAKHLKIKKRMFCAVANVYMSNESDATEKYGEKVGFLKVASERVTEANQLAKNQPEEVVEPLKFINDVVGNKYSAAVKDNDFVYHDSVPAPDRLPSVNGVSLVKAMPFVYDDKDVYISDIFKRLIPMRAHETSSLYSEEKSQLLRTMTKEIEDRDVELGECLTSMQIEDLIDPKMETLPDSLISIHTSLAADTSQMDEVVTGANDLQKLSRVLESNLAELTLALQEEEEQELALKTNNYQIALGEISSFRKDLEKCQGAHLIAHKTNVELIKHIDDSTDVIRLLSGPVEGLVASLPSENVIDAPIDEPVVQRIREILGKVDKMKVQRKDLLQKLRDQVSKDDITNLIVIKEDGNMQEFFKQQLQKHDDLCSIIRQNLSAQDNVLRALTETNAKYATTRKAAKELQTRRDEKIACYTGTFEMFKTIRERLRHGRDFYSQLQESVVILQSSVSEFKKRRHAHRGAPSRPAIPREVSSSKVPQRPSAPKPAFNRSSSATDKPVNPRSRSHSDEPQPTVQIPPSASQSYSLPGHMQSPTINPHSPVTGGFPNAGHTAPQFQPALIEAGGSRSLSAHPITHPMDAHGGGLPPGDPRWNQVSPMHQADATNASSSCGGNMMNNGASYKPTARVSSMGSLPLQPQGALPGVSRQAALPHAVPHGGFQQGVVAPRVTSQLPHTAVQANPQPHPHQSPMPNQAVPPMQPQMAMTGPGNTGVGGHNRVAGPPFVPPYQPQLPEPIRPEKPPGSMPQFQQEQQLRYQQQHAMQMQQNNHPRMPQQQYQPIASQQHPNRMPMSGHGPAMPMQQQPLLPQQQQQQPLMPQQLPLRPQQQLPLRPQQQQQQQAVTPRQQHPFTPQLQQQQPLRPQQQQPPLHHQQSPYRQPSPGTLQQPIIPLQPHSHHGIMTHPEMMTHQLPMHQQQMRPRGQQQQQQQLVPSAQQQQQPMMRYANPASHQQAHPVCLTGDPVSGANPPMLPPPLLPVSSASSYGQNPAYQAMGNGTRPQGPPAAAPPRMPASYGQQHCASVIPTAQPPSPSAMMSPSGFPSGSLMPLTASSTSAPVYSLNHTLSHGMSQSTSMHRTSSPQTYVSHMELTNVNPQRPFRPSAPYNPVGGDQVSRHLIPASPGTFTDLRGTSPGSFSNVNKPFVPSSQAQSADSVYTSYQPPFTAGGGPVTASGRPLMSAVAGGGPTALVGNTTIPSEPAPPKGDQLAFQQMFLMQQQMIALMQTQRQNEDTLHIEQLQRQIQQQQLLIEKISRDQDRISANQSDELIINARLLEEIREQKLRQNDPAVATPNETTFERVSSAPPLPLVDAPQAPAESMIPACYPGANGVHHSHANTPPPAAQCSTAQVAYVPHGLLEREVGTAPFYEPMLDKVSHKTDVSDNQQLATSPQVELNQTEDEQHTPGVAASVHQSADEVSVPVGEPLKSDDGVASERPCSSQADPIVSTSVGSNTTSVTSGTTEVCSHTTEVAHGSRSATDGDHNETTGDNNRDHVADTASIHGNDKLLLDQKHEGHTGKTSQGDAVSDRKSPWVDQTSTGDCEALVAGQQHTPSTERPQSIINNDGNAELQSTDREPMRDRSGLVSGDRPARKTPSPETVDQPTTSQQNVPLRETDEHPTQLEKVASPETVEQPTEPRKVPSSETAEALPKADHADQSTPNTSNVPVVVVASPSQGDDSDNDETLRPALLRQFGHLSERQATIDEKLAWKLYIEELDASVTAMHENCMTLCKTHPRTNIDGFTQIWNDLGQIERLDASGFTAHAGKLHVSKNRYRDILPWDHSRVVLTEAVQDYINANVVQSLTALSPNYIATQGPIPQCFADFWCMVWERDVSVVVMLTNEVEGTKLKCHPYWPRRVNQPMAYGHIVVNLKDEDVQADWKDRTMLVTNTKTNDARIIKHFQFTSWPDYGTPDSPFDILAFMEEVYRFHEQHSSAPLLLHCSAGVGRTGTFACIYSAVREINGGNGLIKIPGTVRKLRQCRSHMVQRKEQLIFCYQAILCHAQQFVAAEQERMASGNAPSSDKEDEVFDDVISGSHSESDDEDAASSYSKMDNETRQPTTDHEANKEDAALSDSKRVVETRQPTTHNEAGNEIRRGKDDTVTSVEKHIVTGITAVSAGGESPCGDVIGVEQNAESAPLPSATEAENSAGGMVTTKEDMDDVGQDMTKDETATEAEASCVQSQDSPHDSHACAETVTTVPIRDDAAVIHKDAAGENEGSEKQSEVTESSGEKMDDRPGAAKESELVGDDIDCRNVTETDDLSAQEKEADLPDGETVTQLTDRADNCTLIDTSLTETMTTTTLPDTN